jgi:hypothetical protein
MLNSSALVGLRVISARRSSVRRSTSPVTGILRLVWKPLTDATVFSSKTPVTSPSHHLTCINRACRRRTGRPWSPALRIAGPGV